MNFEDFILPPPKINFEMGQLGSLFVEDLPENGVAFLVVSDYRGNDFDGSSTDATGFREQFYTLSASDFTMPIYDFGDLISGKTHQDTHYILQEVLSACHYKNTIPVIIGGSLDLSFSMFSALNFHQKNINFTQISNKISLTDLGGDLDEKNYLSRIFSSKNFSLKNFSLLGYQKHLNDDHTVQIMKEVDFETCRLSEMLKDVQNMEPYFRRMHFASVNADAVESFASPFSVNPQVNGLNRREICAYMKEIGLSENLQSLGIFNLAIDTNSILNNQLLAQMLWYTLEGISIQKSHPKEKKLDTFYVIIDDEKYTFKCDIFSKLWYFGDSENAENLVPCSISDYENAKKGVLNSRLLKILNS
jgi:hypothetical protein